MCLYPINFSKSPQGTIILKSIFGENGVMLQQYFSPLIFLNLGSAETVHPSPEGGRWSSTVVGPSAGPNPCLCFATPCSV